MSVRCIGILMRCVRVESEVGQTEEMNTARFFAFGIPHRGTPCSHVGL